MHITVELPDEIARPLAETGDVSRHVLEALTADAYRLQKISRRQVSRILNLDYWQTEELLEKHGVKRPYTEADFEVDRQTLGQALKK
jgi:hypothetical protein